MSSQGYTPGPSSVAAYDRRVIIGSNGQKLGRAHVNAGKLSQEEAESNARLWAAAPNLAAALKEISEADDVDLMLDPSWAKRIALAALSSYRKQGG